MLKEHIKKHLQKTCPAKALQLWYDPLTLTFDSSLAELSVSFPHAFFEQWFKTEGQSHFETAFALWKEEKKLPKASLRYCTFHSAAPQPFLQLGEYTPPTFKKSSSLASFITNTKNAFPLAAAREVANPHSEHSYNPFLVCGKNGTGKTHILRAITDERIRLAHNADAVFHGSVDDLEVLLATHSSPLLCNSHNCFVVDDIQRLAHKQPLQEKLIQFMDACHDQHIQMVFACTGTLSSLDGIGEGLRSRLEVGLVVELKAADLDVRMRFAQMRCLEYGIKLDRAQVLLLSQRCTQLRQLTGIILKIQAFHNLVQRAITLSDIENILRNTGDERQTLPADIVSIVGNYLSVSSEDILGSKRKPDLVLARQTAMYLCRELLGTSYPSLGRFFGGKDHSTVIHSIQKINKLLVSNKDTQVMVTELKQRCQGR